MNHVGGRINCLSNRIKREVENLDSIQSIREISGANGWILVHIHKSKEPVYQKDIERHFGITRSTASKVISLMEKKGLIIRNSVDGDARLKQLVLSEKAIELTTRVDKEIHDFEDKLTYGLSKEEKKSLLSLIDKMEANLQGGSLE